MVPKRQGQDLSLPKEQGGREYGSLREALPITLRSNVCFSQSHRIRTNGPAKGMMKRKTHGLVGHGSKICICFPFPMKALAHTKNGP